jgi:hypothetical protein
MDVLFRSLVGGFAWCERFGSLSTNAMTGERAVYARTRGHA